MSGFYAAVAFEGPLPPPAAYEALEHRLSHYGSQPFQRWRTDTACLGRAHHEVRQGISSEAWDQVLPVVVGSSHLVERQRLRRALAGRQVGVDVNACDTDLVRACYSAHGDTWCHHLHGDFAFVVWDDKGGTLRGSVDHLGVESLYWTFDDRILYVSNTVIGLLDIPGVADTLNDEVVAYFLLLGNTFTYSRASTVFTDIHRLEPGHELIAANGTVQVRQYWQPPFDLPMSNYRNRNDYAVELRGLLDDVVADRLDSVPQATVQLSGGLDSTALLATATSLVGQGRSSTALQAQTMGYNRLTADQEYPVASELAASLGVPFRRFLLDDYRLRRPLPAFAEPADEVRSGLPEAFVASMAQSGAAMSLSGYGADELFLSVPLYRVMLGHSPPRAAALYLWLWRMAGHRPSLGGYRNYLRQLVRPSREPVRVHSPYPKWLAPDFERELQLRERWDDIWEGWARTPDPAHRTQPEVLRAVTWPDWSQPAELLASPSTMPVRASSPFLDLRILDFALRLPPAPWNRRKAILREAMAGVLPDTVLERRKTPAPDFQVELVNAPDAAWVDEHWGPTERLARYVQLDQIPPVRGVSALPSVRSGLRPLLLNDWMEALRHRQRSAK